MDDATKSGTDPGSQLNSIFSYLEVQQTSETFQDLLDAPDVDQ